MTGYRLDWKEYQCDYNETYDTLEEALEQVRFLCSSHPLSFHSRGLPILLTGPTGATIEQDDLWEYGVAFEWGDPPNPTAEEIAQRLDAIEAKAS